MRSLRRRLSLSWEESRRRPANGGGKRREEDEEEGESLELRTLQRENERLRQERSRGAGPLDRRQQQQQHPPRAFSPRYQQQQQHLPPRFSTPYQQQQQEYGMQDWPEPPQQQQQDSSSPYGGARQRPLPQTPYNTLTKKKAGRKGSTPMQFSTLKQQQEERNDDHLLNEAAATAGLGFQEQELYAVGGDTY
jgi:hypothetical protein